MSDLSCGCLLETLSLKLSLKVSLKLSSEWLHMKSGNVLCNIGFRRRFQAAESLVSEYSKILPIYNSNFAPTTPIIPIFISISEPIKQLINPSDYAMPSEYEQNPSHLTRKHSQ